jgi:hypothetical protein
MVLATNGPRPRLSRGPRIYMLEGMIPFHSRSRGSRRSPRWATESGRENGTSGRRADSVWHPFSVGH